MAIVLDVFEREEAAFWYLFLKRLRIESQTKRTWVKGNYGNSMLRSFSFFLDFLPLAT